MLEIPHTYWQIGSVDSEPEVELVDWSVFEVLLTGIGTRTRHFVGTDVFGGQGRVCSPIRSFDPLSRSGVTASGRVYKLVGTRTGGSSDGDYVWGVWTRNNDAKDIVSVTAEIKKLIADAKDANP